MAVVSTAREWFGSVLALAGVAAATASVRHTAQHIGEEIYRVPHDRRGAGHVHYHMAREALVTTGALASVVTSVLAGPGRGRTGWRAMAAVVAGYSAAMWCGGPVTGRWAPSRQAMYSHVGSTTGLVAGVLLLRPRRQER
ncbi:MULTISPECIES: hypothetical protein [unclassified Streptomyces]|uniref:hypothetical protein n=1 Tax=unclassified Streptomyces TaxID=2593676 RepID=UPI0033B35623